ncbi:hypothetical protein C8J57DRAFT_1314739 [Mycena rebaudengoi]|nr:hypothetical protein C8J57DRAFT_1314739 [Mycena rebaudengoi]
MISLVFYHNFLHIYNTPGCSIRPSLFSVPMNSPPPCVSFIVILDFSARWKYVTESVSDLLGWEPNDLRGHSFFQLVHKDEFSQVQQLHYDTILLDKAAAIAYMRLKHKDAHKGYILCAVSRTVVYDMVVGSVSFASPGGKALHNSSTAQEITVITPAASNFDFKPWNDPLPVSRDPPRNNIVHTPAVSEIPTNQSSRTALILDRFSVNCTVTHYSNHQIISAAAATKRAFFDFVAPQDESVVRSWLDVIKTCGVNDRGHPSSGGFGYGRFILCTEGSDSPNSRSGSVRKGLLSRRHNRSQTPAAPAAVTEDPVSTSPKISVDAIFSAHSDGLVVIIRRTP